MQDSRLCPTSRHVDPGDYFTRRSIVHPETVTRPDNAPFSHAVEPSVLSDPDIIAHRGCAGMHPENTVPAVRAVAPHVDVIEIDVRRCGSGELVVCHDAIVDRVTDGSGRVADHTRDELAALDVLDSGAGIPTLDAVLTVIPPGVGVNVELKEQGLAADARSHIERIENDVIVSAFDPEAIDPLATPDRAYELAYLFKRASMTALDTAAELGCEYVHPRVDLCERDGFLDAALQRGFGVNVWTLPDIARRDELAARGVAGLIVDRWDEGP